MIKSRVKTKTGTEDITAVTVSEYRPKQISFGKVLRQKKVYQYAEVYATADTETSHDGLECGWVYQWAVYFNGDFIYGRNPSEFVELIKKLNDYYELSKFKKLIIYFHNMAYDMQYLKQYLYEYDTNMNILATDAHSFLIVDLTGIRILCSYRLSNMSLDLFSRTYSENYIKATGEIDYTVTRYQDTKLTDDDWLYMFSDVRSQHDAISGYLKSMGYDYAYKAPFTSTGFVRTDCRHAAEKDRTWRQKFHNMSLDIEKYTLLHQAFMGGITICNYMYSGETVENVGHKDFTSSYPARQMMDYFPIGRPMYYGKVSDRKTFGVLLNNYCCCFVLELHGVKLKDGITAPYIPSSKCILLSDDNLKLNGKVISAELLSIVVTEIDFKWINRQYDFDEILTSNFLIMKRGPAPNWLKEQVMLNFRNKCSLKKSDPKLYAASKARLNAIYGMTASRIIMDEWYMDTDCMIDQKKLTKEDQIKMLEKYNNSYNSFLPYQFGVWTTAHARNALMEMIEAVGYDNFIYCDTDSVFYIKTPEADENLKRMNEKAKARAIAAGAYVGENYLGYATDEAPVIRFRGLHAKCYAMEEETKDGPKLNVVIAGIPKSATRWENGKPVTTTNSEELVSIDNLQDGFVFKHCGGTRAVYIEDIKQEKEINGHMTECGSSVIIDQIEKEISNTMYAYDKDYSILHIKQQMIL